MPRPWVLCVCFAALVGDDDLGRIALRRLSEVGVDISGAIVDPSTSTGVTILLSHGAERHSLTYQGSIAALTVDQLDRQSLLPARHFHLSSLFLQPGLHPDIVNLLRFLKSSGVSTSLDTNDDPEDSGEAPCKKYPVCDLFLPNERELCRMAGGLTWRTHCSYWVQRCQQSSSSAGRLGWV